MAIKKMGDYDTKGFQPCDLTGFRARCAGYEFSDLVDYFRLSDENAMEKELPNHKEVNRVASGIRNAIKALGHEGDMFVAQNGLRVYLIKGKKEDYQ